MSTPLIVVVGSQLLFTASDLLARAYMPERGFEIATFISGWFVLYLLVRTAATFGQLYVFSIPALELGETMALFGAVSIILANVLGYLLLSEVLQTGEYIGVVLAILAFLVLALQ